MAETEREIEELAKKLKLLTEVEWEYDKECPIEDSFVHSVNLLSRGGDQVDDKFVKHDGKLYISETYVANLDDIAPDDKTKIRKSFDEQNVFLKASAVDYEPAKPASPPEPEKPPEPEESESFVREKEELAKKLELFTGIKWEYDKEWSLFYATSSGPIEDSFVHSINALSQDKGWTHGKFVKRDEGLYISEIFVPELDSLDPDDKTKLRKSFDKQNIFLKAPVVDDGPAKPEPLPEPEKPPEPAESESSAIEIEELAKKLELFTGVKWEYDKEWSAFCVRSTGDIDDSFVNSVNSQSRGDKDKEYDKFIKYDGKLYINEMDVAGLDDIDSENKKKLKKSFKEQDVFLKATPDEDVKKEKPAEVARKPKKDTEPAESEADIVARRGKSRVLGMTGFRIKNFVGKVADVAITSTALVGGGALLWVGGLGAAAVLGVAVAAATVHHGWKYIGDDHIRSSSSDVLGMVKKTAKIAGASIAESMYNSVDAALFGAKWGGLGYGAFLVVTGGLGFGAVACAALACFAVSKSHEWGIHDSNKTAERIREREIREGRSRSTSPAAVAQKKGWLKDEQERRDANRGPKPNPSR